MMSFMGKLLSDSATWRACVRCPAIWLGEMACEVCGSDGEPIADRDADPAPMIMEIVSDASSDLPN